MAVAELNGSKPQVDVASINTGDSLVSALRSVETSPLWAHMTRLNPPAPNPTTVPYLWDYDVIKPYLLKAGELVTEKQAERRVLMLINPKRTSPYTTDTLYAGLQLVNPNETASAHRHTAFAVRFIIEGTGGFTAVHGKRVTMRPRDVIITPTWNYHDHGNTGADNGPVIWLDGLNLPSFTHFPIHFVQHFEKPRYPATDIDVDDSPIVFPWSTMQQALDAAPSDWNKKEYTTKAGQPISKVIGASAERFNSGASSPEIRETVSSVYHVIEGSGWSEIGETRLSWKQGDTFCIPAWHKYQHHASSSGKVYLYRFDDKPMLKSLGFYRVEGMTDEDLLAQ